MRFTPSIAWDPTVSNYFEHAFGRSKLQEISESLCRPSLRTCLRVNTRVTTPQVVVEQLQHLFPSTQPYTHPVVSSAVIVPGRGPLQPDYQPCDGREVVVNRLAGESVLKGANVFAPGMLAATPGIAAGDLVAISVALEQPGGGWCGVNRGMSLTADLKQQLPQHHQLYIGTGRVTAGRRGLFRAQEGLAVEMLDRVFQLPPCNGVLRGHVMLQALPSIVAAQALDPQPGSRILDMCAAPGGKTSMLAQIMGDSGTVIALDRTQAKVQEIQSLAADWGLTCVQAYAADATQLYQQDKLQQQQQQQQQQQKEEAPGMLCTAVAGINSPLQAHACLQGGDSSASHCQQVQKDGRKRRRVEATAGSSISPEVLAVAQPSAFDAVLLDAPCSALGLRPRLLVDWTLAALEKLAAYQRALLHSAVHVLKPGGHLVYCTCTINPGENEANVRYVLDRWPQMQLVEQPVRLGGPGLIGDGWLTAGEADLVQRFDPLAGLGDDTIGFFVARFVKQGSTA